jgi:hypothetical protein
VQTGQGRGVGGARTHCGQTVAWARFWQGFGRRPWRDSAG